MARGASAIERGERDPGRAVDDLQQRPRGSRRRPSALLPVAHRIDGRADPLGDGNLGRIDPAADAGGAGGGAARRFGMPSVNRMVTACRLTMASAGPCDRGNPCPHQRRREPARTDGDVLPDHRRGATGLKKPVLFSAVAPNEATTTARASSNSTSCGLKKSGALNLG